VLTVWVIYERPVEYPQGYVVRPQFAMRGGEVRVSVHAWASPNLDTLRGALPDGLVPFTRQPNDDPAIIEAWL
jgi:hypothetical protein